MVLVAGQYETGSLGLASEHDGVSKLSEGGLAGELVDADVAGAHPAYRHVRVIRGARPLARRPQHVGHGPLDQQFLVSQDQVQGRNLAHPTILSRGSD